MAGLPDLQAILATLSQFVAPAPGPSSAQNERGSLSTDQNAVAHEWNAAVTGRANLPSRDPRLRPQNRTATSSPKPMIDPATITNWQEGLRCVTKLAAQNVQFAVSIRKMMANQRQNELRWYSDRQALKHSRAKSMSRLDVANGSDFGLKRTSTPESSEDELRLFDRKIYDAQLAMEESMTGELKALGVPFFGTHSDLVVPDGFDVTEANRSEVRAKWSPLVTESELLALRRRMVSHLEDLYRD